LTDSITIKGIPNLGWICDKTKKAEDRSAYKLGDNFSVLQASEWLNQPEMLEQYEFPSLDEKNLYRAVELLGHNREKIIQRLQANVLELLGYPPTDIMLDWTSIALYWDMLILAKYGYSRDHQPGERQLTLGAAMLGPPYDVPVGHLDLLVVPSIARESDP
jgi:transposase